MSARSFFAAPFPTPTMAWADSVLVAPCSTISWRTPAAEAGAEVREGFTVDELLVTDDTVVGVRGHGKDGGPVEERARMVIGADGVNSFVARAVRAAEYDVRPVAACGYYSYFSGVRQDDIELYVRDHHAFGGAPTNDGLHLVMVNWPARDFPPAVRADIEGHVWRALESAPDFASRVREGRREEKSYGTAGVPSYFRKPYGKGWGARRRRELQQGSDYRAGY